MKDLVIVYKSKYGSTEKYAKELAKILNADIFDESNIKITDLKNYKTLIYGGGVYASGIAGITLITKNFEILKDMNLIIFTVTLSNPLETDFSNLIKHNFKNIDSSKLHLFHLRGGIDYKTLNFID
ncbi:MAG: flavodoxin domain-containing protein, partial [Sarcina sp.]